MIRNLQILVFIHVFVLSAFAQEEKLPAGVNQQLRSYLATQPLQEAAIRQVPFSKAAGGMNFPFVERFINSGALSDSLWLDDDATKRGRSAIFDAKSASGNVYTGGGYGECDKLTSRPVNLYLSNGLTYVYFSFGTGSTWQNGDSLVLQLRTSGGNYRSVWVSPDAITAGEEVVVPLGNLTDYIAVNFQIRFISYGARSIANTENFILNFVSVADKWALPLTENFLSYDTPGVKLASGRLWMQQQTRVLPGPVINAAVFDAMDETGTLYNGGAGGGYADTLMSHLINVQQYAESDSVYLSFFYESAPSTLPTDSLILEYRNNVGVWSRIWQDGGIITGRKTFSSQINAGRFRHANFQFRLIGKNNYTANDSAQFLVRAVSVGSRLSLPFLEDFSTSDVYPDQRKWRTRHTYINNHFPVFPPSINVATFDALDSKGTPYGSGRGYCDTMTSQPISLAGLSVADSVYLSFYFQPGGKGEAPNSNDSLILEFRNSPLQETFVNAWGTTISSYPVNAFTRVDVLVRDSAFFHNAFQFRFKNQSSKAGNINHWHVDYIRMDKGRTRADAYLDIAVNANSGSLLTPYTSMPYRHFVSNPAGFTKPEQFIGVKNNSANAFPIVYSRNVYDPDGNLVDTAGNILPNLPASSDTLVTINDLITLSSASTADSIVFRTRYGGRNQNAIDNIPFNDSVTVPTIFSNYFSYDDGSAESGYAIKNAVGSVALAYTLTVPDTLIGIAMFFNRSTTDVTGLPFNLMVWKGIGTNGNGSGETVLNRTAFTAGPVYLDKINGFFYYRFPNRIALPAGRFYIGWEQTQQFQLNMGVDENFNISGNPVNPNLYYKIEDVWRKTALTGGLMMRPLLGKWLQPPVGMEEVIAETKLDIMLYPNPAKDLLMFKTEGTFPLAVSVYDLSGRKLVSEKTNDPQIQLPSLDDGLYIVNISDAKGISAVKKLMIKN